MQKTGILALRFGGCFGGSEPKKDDQLGVTYQKVTFLVDGGKKYVFKVYGELKLGVVQPFQVIVVDVYDAVFGKAGEFGNYGDQNIKCSDIVLVPEKQAAAPSPPKQQ